MHRYDAFTKNMLKNEKIKKYVNEYLEDIEQYRLARTSKILYQSMENKIRNLKNLNIDKILTKINQNKKKSCFFKVDIKKNSKEIKQILNDIDFSYIDTTKQNEFEQIKKNFDKSQIDLDKFSYFYSQNLNLILRISRVWVDSSLNIQKQKQVETEQINKEQLIAKINTNNAFDPRSIDYHYQKHKLLQKELKDLQLVNNNKKTITLQQFLNCKQYCYVLFEGGDFCFITFKNHKDIFHTSQHKYIVRAKGGGKKQSEKDRTKSIKSIGSQIRRENEKVLNQKIKEIIIENLKTLQESDYVFLFAPSTNTNTIMAHLKDNDIDTQKVRSLGADLSKASYEQGIKIHEQNCKIQLVKVNQMQKQFQLILQNQKQCLAAYSKKLIDIEQQDSGLKKKYEDFKIIVSGLEENIFEINLQIESVLHLKGSTEQSFAFMQLKKKIEFESNIIFIRRSLIGTIMFQCFYKQKCKKSLKKMRTKIIYCNKKCF